MTTTERPNVCYGDHDVAVDNEILRTTVGSGVHGIAIEGTDDHDEMGIFIEPPEHVIGTKGPYDDHTCRTVPEGVRSGPGDTDLTIYSLRKWMKLALHGNPTVLLPLYAPLTEHNGLIHREPLGMELRDLAPYILSRAAGQRFLGYLDGQRERMLGGGRRSKVPKRPELVAKYGFDVKYASHALRLGYQGVEVLEKGYLTLPMEPEIRQIILDIKTGAYTFGQVMDMIDAQRAKLVALIGGASPLPEQPAYDVVNAWMVEAHLRWWRENNLT